MWDERLEDYLNENDDLEKAGPDVRRQYAVYRYVMELYAAKVSYSPSEKLKREFLKRIRRRNIVKRSIKYALIAGSATAAFLLLKFGFGMGTGLESPRNDLFNDVVNSVQIIRTLGDGF